MLTQINSSNAFKIKTFLKLLLIVISLCSCNDPLPKQKNDLEKLKLLGNVKQLTEITFFRDFKTIESFRAEPKFELSSKEITKFNLNGNIEETQHIGSDVLDTLTQNPTRYIYVYDNNGILLKRYYAIKGLEETTYNYDNRGNLIKILTLINSIPLIYKQEYKYDRNDKLIEEAVWDTSTIPKIKNTHKYDQKGYKRETTFYKRNKNGQLLFHSKTHYTYDSIGAIVETLSFNSNTLATKSSFIYDSYGNTILCIQYNSNGVMTDRDSTYYEYDYNKNWIKKMDYYSSPPFNETSLLCIEQRIIDYY